MKENDSTAEGKTNIQKHTDNSWKTNKTHKHNSGPNRAVWYYHFYYCYCQQWRD